METLRLQDVDPQKMDCLFSEELQAWDEQFGWDYRPALQLVLRLIRSKTLPGFVLLNDQRKPVGYAYYVIDSEVAFIGNVFVRAEQADLTSYRTLLGSTMDSIQEAGTVERIESQVFAFNYPLRPLFEEFGFQAIQRFFLRRPISTDPLEALIDSQEFDILAWDGSYTNAVGEVISDSYLDSQDARICRDYQSLEGCIRFVRNLILNPACGRFCPETTLLAKDRGDRLCGVLLASRIQASTGMIPQLSIRRDCQRKGLGRLLLSYYFRAAARNGIRVATLSVSADNTRALSLYRGMGFTLARKFYAYVKE